VKKRLASLIMALALCLTFLPATARAAVTVNVCGTDVTGSNDGFTHYWKANGSKNGIVTATSSDATIIYAPGSPATLTLNGVDLGSYDGQYAIETAIPLTITLADGTNNKLAAGNGANSSWVIHSAAGGLTITGSGSLTLTARKTTGDNTTRAEGIYCASGGLTINGGANVTVTAGEYGDNAVAGVATLGIDCNGGALTVSGATVTVTAGKSKRGTIGITANVGMTIESGANVTVTACASDNSDSLGISCSSNDVVPALTVSGAGTRVEVTAGDAKGNENGSRGILSAGDVIVDDGANVTVTAGDAAGEAGSCGILSASNMTVKNGAEVSVKALSCTNGTSFGIYCFSSADLTVDGGTVTVTPVNGNESWASTYGISANGITINSSTVNATGCNSKDNATFGIEARGTLSVTNSEVTATAGGMNTNSSTASLTTSYGIKAADVTINSGTVTAKGGAMTGGGSYNGKLTSAGIYSTAAVMIGGGEVKATGGTITGGNTDSYSAGIDAAGAVTVKGTATLTATGTGDGSYGVKANSLAISETTVKKVDVSGGNALKFSGTASLTTVLDWKGFLKGSSTGETFPADTEADRVTDYARVVFPASAAVTTTPTEPTKPDPKPTTPEREPSEPFSQTFQSPLTFDGGKIVVSPESAGIRDTVTLTVVPDAGMELKDLSVNMKGVTTTGNVKLTDKGNGVYTFQQPGGNTEIKAKFGEATAQSAAIDEPEQVQTAAEEVNAQLSRQTITVNGRALDVKAYNIDGHNYVMLRDLAAMLAGTSAKFTVRYDERENKVTIEKGVDYDGALSSDPRDLSRSAMRSRQVVCCDGNVLEGLNVFNIGGNNFFSLRELAEFIGYGITYDEASDTAIISI